MEATPRRQTLAARVQSLESFIAQLSAALETQIDVNKAHLADQDALAAREADLASREVHLANAHAALLDAETAFAARSDADSGACVELGAGASASETALETALRGRKCGFALYLYPGQPVRLPWTVLAAFAALAVAFVLVTTSPSEENAASARAAAEAAARAMADAQSARSVFVAALLQLLALFTSMAVDSEVEVPLLGRVECLQQGRQSLGMLVAGLAVGVIASAVHILAPMQRLTASYRAATAPPRVRAADGSLVAAPPLSSLSLSVPAKVGLRAYTAAADAPSPVARRYEAFSPRSFSAASVPGAATLAGFASPFAPAAASPPAQTEAPAALATPARPAAGLPAGSRAASAVKLTPAAAQWARAQASAQASALNTPARATPGSARASAAAVNAAVAAANAAASAAAASAAASPARARSPAAATPTPRGAKVTTDAADLRSALKSTMYSDYFAGSDDDAIVFSGLASPVPNASNGSRAPLSPPQGALTSAVAASAAAAAAAAAANDDVPFASVIDASFGGADAGAEEEEYYFDEDEDGDRDQGDFAADDEIAAAGDLDLPALVASSVSPPHPCSASASAGKSNSNSNITIPAPAAAPAPVRSPQPQPQPRSPARSPAQTRSPAQAQVRPPA